MDKTVDFFNCQKKRKASGILNIKEKIKGILLLTITGINILSVGSWLLNNGLMQKIIFTFCSNLIPVNDVDFTASDITKIYPVLNEKSYIVAEEKLEIVKQEISNNIAEDKEETKSFDGSAVEAFSFNPNKASNLKISYTSNYQKAKLYGITITNYATKTDIDYEGLMNKEINLSKVRDKVLLYCTHTSESFVNSNGYKFNYTGTMRTKDAKYNMLSVASVLKEKLQEKNFNVTFDTTPHDYTSYDNAYTNSRATIKNNLNKNGKFGLMIDVHRDAYGGLNNGPIVEINGKRVALIMIVVGIGTKGYENPYWETNLAIAMQIMKKGEEMYPGLFRPLLIRDSKYNQDMNEGAILTEMGTTGNTHEEVFYAATCLANVLNEVFK